MIATITNAPDTGSTILLQFEHGIDITLNAKPVSGTDGLADIKRAAFFAAAGIIGQENAEQAFMDMDNEIAAKGGLL